MLSGQLSKPIRYFAPETFDTVVLSGVFGFGLDSVPEQDASIAACAAILKPEGILVLGWNTDRVSDPEMLPKLAECFRRHHDAELPDRIMFKHSTHVFDMYGRRHRTTYSVAPEFSNHHNIAPVPRGFGFERFPDAGHPQMCDLRWPAPESLHQLGHIDLSSDPESGPSLLCGADNCASFIAVQAQIPAPSESGCFTDTCLVLLCHKIRRRVRCWQQGHLDMLRAMARANDELGGW